ncbi:hypothetical protein ABIB06_007473 [Bradyrhizobium sp. LB8.2]|uniref:hypothetical protein n=1 Tax=unclassified Bradyrhizobium TaxID=2631580 RepID=UPI003398522E
MNVHTPHQPTGDPVGSDESTDGKVSAPQITLITKRDAPSLMSKRIALDAGGELKSDGSECRMTSGTAAREFVGTASALALIIAGCRPDQAITLGALKAELPNRVAVTTPSKLSNYVGAITRSRSCIDYEPGLPAWCLIDFDTKGMPDEVRAQIEAAGGMWNALLTVAPELAKAARVSRASTTAGLFRSDTKELIAGSNGMHHYVLVRDGGDVERLKDLHERCWFHGFGWHLIGGAGQLLDRSIVDRMVGYGERLCFEGAPIIAAPLAQDQAKRAPEAIEGEAIDSALAVARLTRYERQRVTDAKATSAKALGKAAAEIRSKHDEELAQEMSAKSDTPIATARRLVKSRHDGVLYSDVELQFDHLDEVVTVSAVMADPDRYVGETLADPLEGLNYGRCKAMVMSGSEGDLFIHSFAHGRSIYRLRHDLKSSKAAFEQIADGSIDDAMAILAHAELEADEDDQFAEFVADKTKTSVRSVRARSKKEREERRAKAAEASMEAKADGRMILPRPEPYGELTPTVSFLDEVLAKDASQEPPMRDASGALVRVEEKEPWALHLLTSESANAAAEQAEDMKAPTEPVLVTLTPTGVELLIEKYVGWIAQKKDGSVYLASLPPSYIAAVMEYPNSAVPVARAINTCPLITASARLIEGAGLDRATGLFHRIDPALRKCVPENKPADEDIKKPTFVKVWRR